MSRWRFVIFALLAAGLLVLGVLVGGLFVRFLGTPRTVTVFNPAAVLRQVQTFSHIVTVKYVMEKVIVVEDERWYGANRVLLVAQGVVKAGIELDRLKPGDIQVSGKRIEIRLPPARITDAYLDEKQTKVVEYSNALLRSFNKDLESTARQHAVSEIRAAAAEAGIHKDAQERARTLLRELFRSMGYEEVEFTER